MPIYPFPNNYRRRKRSSTHAYLRGYEHYFYANLNSLINDSDFDDWVIGLFNRQSNEVQNFGSLVKDEIEAPDFRFYKSFIIDSSVNTGLYYFVIYNSVNEEVKFISNCFEVINNDSISEYAFFQYKNSTNQFNFNYEDLPIYNTYFLKLNVVESQPELDLTQYPEQTTGKVRNQKSQAKKVISLESYFFDDGDNDAMLSVSIHDDILLNGSVIEVKEGYKIESNKFNDLQKGVIEVYDQNVSTINLKG